MFIFLNAYCLHHKTNSLFFQFLHELAAWSFILSHNKWGTTERREKGSQVKGKDTGVVKNAGRQAWVRVEEGLLAINVWILSAIDPKSVPTDTASLHSPKINICNFPLHDISI